MLEKKAKIPVKEWMSQYKQQFQRYKSYCLDNDWRYTDNKEEEYEIQKDISKIVLNRLKYFVDKFEPYLEYKYVQEFVTLMQTPVDLFLERCNDYFLANDWLSLKDKERQVDEMNFQADMMSDFNTFKDLLQKLNLDEEVLSMEIPLHSDKVIPFLMRDLMEEKYPKIKEFKNTLGSDIFDEGLNVKSHTKSEVLDSKEMFINMKNPPVYDETKHYFEQSKDVIQFFEEEHNKILNGVNINGVFIHPWLYWHINYFKTDIPMAILKGTPKYNPKKQRLITQPFLRDNELFFAECYQEADEKNVGLFVFGTRRFGKTIIESSMLTWRTSIIEASESMVIGGDEGDLQKLTKSLEIAFSNVHPAFRLTRNNNDWKKHIQFGLKDKAGNKIPYSDVFIRNVVSGQDKASEKTAGATPTAWIVDEAGKFACKDMYDAAIPSFQNPEGWALVPLLCGTGGNKELSADAQRMLLNPEANSILPMNWDRLEKYVTEKDLISWKRKDFGIYLPAQMSFKEGLKKEVTTLGDFFNNEDEILNRIELRLTNWEHALDVIKKSRAKKQNDKTGLNKEKMYYPLDPLECFLNRIENPFPAVEAQTHKEEIIKEGKTGRLVDVYRKKGTTNLGFEFSNKELATFPFEGGNIDAPVLMFENPPEDNIMDGTYVAGLDHYKHDKASTDSLGVLKIFKRNVNLDEWSGRLVCSYASRPERIETFNSICEMLIEGYGAECLMENADISFQQHLRAKHKDTLLLAKGEEFAQKFINAKATQNNKYGLNPNQKNQQYLLNLVISYCHEEIEVGEDENGDKIVVKGVTRINDIHLLDEIINFTYSGNFDRIIAFGHALAWGRYLDSLYIMPKSKKTKEEVSYYRQQARKQRSKRRSPYSTIKRSPYKR